MCSTDTHSLHFLLARQSISLSHLINICPLPFQYFICLPLSSPPLSFSAVIKRAEAVSPLPLAPCLFRSSPSRMFRSTIVECLLFPTPSISTQTLFLSFFLSFSPLLILSVLSSQLSAFDSSRPPVISSLPPFLCPVSWPRAFYRRLYCLLAPHSFFFLSVLWFCLSCTLSTGLSQPSKPLTLWPNFYFPPPLSFFLSVFLLPSVFSACPPPSFSSPSLRKLSHKLLQLKTLALLQMIRRHQSQL